MKRKRSWNTGSPPCIAAKSVRSILGEDITVLLQSHRSLSVRKRGHHLNIGFIRANGTSGRLQKSLVMIRNVCIVPYRALLERPLKFKDAVLEPQRALKSKLFLDLVE